MIGDLLVDTSAWIAGFRATGSLRLKEFLKEALDLNRVATTNIVMLELLQGCETAKEFDAMKARLEVLPFYAIRETTWQTAYTTGFFLRRKGITVPAVDILICSIAKDHTLSILHHDDHFKTISREMGIKSVDFLKNDKLSR